MRKSAPIDRPPAVLRLLREVAARHRLPHWMELCRSGGPRIYMPAKREAAARLRDRGYSLPQVGHYLGGIHHTSVLWLLNHTPRVQPERPSVEHEFVVPVPDLSGEWAI